MRIFIGGIALSLAVLSGCSGGAQSVTPTSTTPQPARDMEYPTVVALKDAAVRAGYPCPSWSQDNRITKAAESGSCTDADVFSTYLSHESRDSVVTFLKTSGVSVTLLVGPNWIISSKSAPSLQSALGGVVVSGT
ncbi:MAG: hypothetical protein IPL80_19880 [Sterolibacteriaceae bacterium]|nr:hypothetical protein [Sterolibacteriaceae bacterium]